MMDGLRVVSIERNREEGKCEMDGGAVVPKGP